MASQNNNNNIDQKPLNQKEITNLLFREEITNPTEDSSFEGSQDEINIFNDVFSRNDPSLFEQSRIKLQNNMAMCRIVESSGRGISCYNICCILPDKKEISHDKTGTSTSTTSIRTGTKEVSHDKTGTITGTKEISHDKTATITGTGMKEVFQDKTGTKEVSRDKTGTVPTVPTKPASPSQMELETVNKNNKRDESGTSRIVPVPPNPVSSQKEPKMVDQIGTKLNSIGTELHFEERNHFVPVFNATIPSQTVNQNPKKETLNSRRIVKEPVESLKDLCTDLRANANRLLADCGYKLELRMTKGKNSPNHIYHLPHNGPVIQNLPKAWISLGNLLFANRTGTGTAGKQWVGIGEFKSDLRNMLIYIENMMKNNNSELSLLDRWFLLDPFVAVTSVDRKIWALKKGIPIKAINSKTSYISENEIIDLKNKNGNECEKTLLPLVMSQSENQSGKEVQNAINLHENSVTNSKTSVICENEIIDLNNKNVNQCEKTLLPLVRAQSESQSEQEVQNAIILHEKELPIGSKFAINQVKQSTGTQYPVLILYPYDIQLSLDGEGKITVTETGNEIPDFQPGNEIPVFEPSFFQGTLAFDKTSGFEMKESFINWVVYNHGKSKSKHKRKLNSDSKENRSQKKLKEITGTSEKKRVCPFNGQDLLISAIVMKKASKYLENPKIPSFNIQTVKIPSKKKRFSKGPRTVLKLLINRGLVSVNSKIFYTKSKLIKGGKLTRKGVLCDCCNELFSISGFKRHTHFDAELGLMNLFVGFGKPYVICLFKAWESEYKEMRERVMKVRERDIERNDDACGLCADAGELVSCDGCPASFHESCLPDQNIPEESWNCPRCKCDICGDFVSKSMEISSSNGFLECFQCGNKYHEKCRKDKRVVLNEDSPLNTWFCENACHQIYTYMRSEIGKSIPINNGLYFTTLRCNHEETKKTLNSDGLARLAENNMKLAVACRLMEECFDEIVDLRTGVDLIPLVMYNWRVETVNLDCTGFYTVVLEKDDRIISVASIRLHGTKAAEMPLIATCSENRKQGMCRRLVSTIQQMLKYLNVEMLLILSTPNLVETWISRFGFVLIEETDKEVLCKLNLITVPNTVLLKKNLRRVPEEFQGCSYTSSQNQLKEVGSQEVQNNLDSTRN